jgi:signal transduction histidine kinase
MPRPDDLLSNGPQAERLHKFAHDLRNRLAGMYQVLQHLAAGAVDPEQKQLVEFGEQQQFKALREVEQLLDDMGVVRHMHTLPCTAVLLAPLVEKAVQGLRHRFDRKQQTVLVDLPEGLHVLGHADQLFELLNALLSNASKFSAAGAAVTVNAQHHGTTVSLQVMDTGVGLSPADLDQVFVRYAWLSSRTTAGEAQGRSTLARARQWARAMGGDLLAESAGPGAGSTFTLVLRHPALP